MMAAFWNFSPTQRRTYVYFADDPSRHRLVNRLSGADAKAVARTFARELTAEVEGGAYD